MKNVFIVNTFYQLNHAVMYTKVNKLKNVTLMINTHYAVFNISMINRLRSLDIFDTVETFSDLKYSEVLDSLNFLVPEVRDNLSNSRVFIYDVCKPFSIVLGYSAVNIDMVVVEDAYKTFGVQEKVQLELNQNMYPSIKHHLDMIVNHKEMKTISSYKPEGFRDVEIFDYYDELEKNYDLVKFLIYMYDVDLSLFPNGISYDIVLTQPLDKVGYITESQQKELYKLMAQVALMNAEIDNKIVIIKSHPSDETDYGDLEKMYKNLYWIRGSFTVDLLNYSNLHISKAYSVCSSSRGLLNADIHITMLENKVTGFEQVRDGILNCLDSLRCQVK